MVNPQTNARSVGRNSPSAKELAWLLSQNCEALFQQLIPDAYFEGGEIRGHAPDGGVISMALRGRKRGRWCNWNAEKQSGDCLDLVTVIECAGDRKRAYAWSCHYLGITEDYRPLLAVATARAQPVRREKATTPVDQARRLYDRGWENGPEVLSYLSGRLGGPVERLLPEMPRCLRFVPDVWHHPTVRRGLPAMVAPVVNPITGAHCATHVTFLAKGPSGWGKASVQPDKICVGSSAGGIIPLLRGAFGRPLSSMEPGETIVVGEGIANALAAATLRDDAPRVWAAVSNGNFKCLRQIQQPMRWVIVEDCDQANQATAKVLADLMDDLLKAGHSVEWMRAPPPFKDMAAFLASRLPDVLGGWR